jgi:uncharacterized membrane protein
VKISAEKTGTLSKSLKLNNKGYKIAVTLAVVFVFSLLIGYYFVSRLPPEGYTSISLLDYQNKKAIDYPELLVVNENSTFSVWVEVENHMGTSQACEVLQKVTTDTIPSFPVEANVENSYTQTIENGATWETLATVSINETGSYAVIFELWLYSDETFQFTYNYCVLNVDVVDQG